MWEWHAVRLQEPARQKGALEDERRERLEAQYRARIAEVLAGRASGRLSPRDAREGLAMLAEMYWRQRRRLGD